jgi:hypothetical protein
MKIGMTRKQLSTAVQEHLAGPGLGDTADCYYTEAKTYPGVALMILQGKLARIDVAATGTTTEERIGVGDSERHVLAVYGTRGRVTPNAYDSTDDIVTVLSADKKTGFKFVMDEKKVRLIYAGRADALEFIEGCE